MAMYLVMKRTVRGEGVSGSGDTLSLDPNDKETQILIERGFIVPVPDNYKPDESVTAPSNALDPDATPATKDELMKLNRGELNVIAKDEGIETPEELPNKETVADAIVARREEAHNNPDADNEDDLVEVDFAKIISELSDDDLAGSIELYEVEVDGEGREAQETALLAWAKANPDVFKDDDIDDIPKE